MRSVSTPRHVRWPRVFPAPLRAVGRDLGQAQSSSGMQRNQGVRELAKLWVTLEQI